MSDDECPVLECSCASQPTPEPEPFTVVSGGSERFMMWFERLKEAQEASWILRNDASRNVVLIEQERIDIAAFECQTKKTTDRPVTHRHDLREHGKRMKNLTWDEVKEARADPKKFEELLNKTTALLNRIVWFSDYIAPYLKNEIHAEDRIKASNNPEYLRRLTMVLNIAYAMCNIWAEVDFAFDDAMSGMFITGVNQLHANVSELSKQYLDKTETEKLEKEISTTETYLRTIPKLTWRDV